MRSLQRLVSEAAARTPDAPAIKGPDGELTYAELDRLAWRIARSLADLGVGKGDRVGIWLDKSVAAVAAMQGILRLGAAYVPLDPLSPAARIGGILRDCSMRALVTSATRGALLGGGESEQSSARSTSEGYDVPRLLISPGPLADLFGEIEDAPLAAVESAPDELAYILYTSGSTGVPKGVCISHRNALAFVDWAAEEIAASATDRFANHAPFHFDLSVLDLYAAFRSGASVVLIPDGMSYVPARLVQLIDQERITILYAVPSVLILMTGEGKLLEREGLALRVAIFAGEPFPIRPLRRLRDAWPHVRLLNFYGPTETNVCTSYEVHAIDAERTSPPPIGAAASGDRVWAVRSDGEVAGVGEEGELFVSGPTVMLGYWGREPQGDRPYATGDVVRVLEGGQYDYVGRRDHMVKVRGHRIELGDIEAALQQHPAVEGAAVVVRGEGMSARLVAFLVAGAARPSLLDVKRHCAERLPRYMIVDDVHFRDELPLTRNGKTDRRRLLETVTTTAKDGNQNAIQ